MRERKREWFLKLGKVGEELGGVEEGETVIDTSLTA